MKLFLALVASLSLAATAKPYETLAGKKFGGRSCTDHNIATVPCPSDGSVGTAVCDLIANCNAVIYNSNENTCYTYNMPSEEFEGCKTDGATHTQVQLSSTCRPQRRSPSFPPSPTRHSPARPRGRSPRCCAWRSVRCAHSSPTLSPVSTHAGSSSRAHTPRVPPRRPLLPMRRLQRPHEPALWRTAEIA